jgi:hypothetical protein
VERTPQGKIGTHDRGMAITGFDGSKAWERSERVNFGHRRRNEAGERTWQRRGGF